MSHNIPTGQQTGQQIGSSIEYALFFAAGAYLAWYWPRRVRRQIQSGKFTEE